MFVVTNNRRGIYNNFLLNNKELPTGDNSERLVYLTSRLFVNPKGNSAYTIIFDMTNENNCVALDKPVPVTPAQAALLNFLDAHTLEQIIHSLEIVQENSLYHCDPELVHLPSNHQVHLLLDELSNLKS